MVSPSNWERIRALFYSALERAPGERVAYLRAQSSDDEILREVASLLAAHEDADALLDAAGRKEADASIAQEGAGRGGSSTGTLPPGAQLGPYMVVCPLGAGAMGEVYRARDTNLRRDVALKVLPEALAANRDRLARFTREARTLGALNHPHIAQVHGFEEYGGVRALVMELVEGQDLAHHVARGPIRVAEALRVGRQIAEALEAAHARGIVHRDLKPANIMIRDDGTVKVLDFGLAKAWMDDTTPPIASADGAIVGTAAYMSPEQAEGKAVDSRSDIWSFGVVLYELLAGTRLFGGTSAAHALADILHAPLDFDKLPAETPTRIRELLSRCLDRDVQTRLQHIGEARIVLQGGQAFSVPRPATAPVRRHMLPWMVAAASAMVALAALYLHIPTSPVALPPPLTRLAVLPPEDLSFFRPYGFGGSAMSPDGTMLAFAAVGDTPGGRQQRLYVRRMDSLEARLIQGSEGAAMPFWSTDSRSLAFYAGGLKRADLEGGEPFSIAGVPGGRGGGGDWNRFGVILVGSVTGIKRVPASGGPLTAVTTTNASHEDFHGFPKFLPDAKHFLYLGHSAQGSPGQSAIYVSSLDDGAHRVKILETAYGAVYAPGSRDPNQGWLLFINGTTLMAQAFDAGTLKVQGEATMVGQGVALDAIFGHADVSVSATGVLAYGPSFDSDSHRLAWYDRKGTAVSVIGESASYLGFRISPDGRSVVALRRDPKDGHTDLWLVDLARGASTRMTFSGSSSNAAWSPDSTAIVWGKVGLGLYHKRVSGGAEEPLLPGDAWHPSWSPDGRAIAFTMPQGEDISVLPLGPAGTAEAGQPYAYIKTPLPESRAAFSPDGRWVAYQAQESATPQVYVQPFPATGARWRISTGSGASPRWASGQELFYVQGRTLMAVRIAVSGDAIVAGTPAELFEIPRGNLVAWDVARGGQRILAGERAVAGQGVRPITVVMNWQESLRK